MSNEQGDCEVFGKASRVSSPLEYSHFDICEPMNIYASHGAFYFLTFIDDYSRNGYVHMLLDQYEALNVFKHLIAEVKTQLEHRVMTL